MKTKKFLFKAILTENGWLKNMVVAVDAKGKILALKSFDNTDEIDEHVNGYALPGFQNTHSHAFQYAMAGLAEYHDVSVDDFWSWRSAMYDLALHISPNELEVVATQLYSEMACMGYTSVVEFQYLHNATDGNFYDNKAEMGQVLINAAQKVGINLTLVPVLYQQGNFGQLPDLKQKRFIIPKLDDYLKLLEDSEKMAEQYDNVRIAWGAHSLRAVGKENLSALINLLPAKMPFHIHVAEQLKEVKDCIDYYGQRPVEWLLNNFQLSENFHFVHATHMTDKETIDLAARGVNVILCPSTEGNLGDGVFNLGTFQKHNGNWSIGTDSHIKVDHLEDLRWLDYSQRLVSHNRAIFVQKNLPDAGFNAIKMACLTGRKAMGNASPAFFAQDTSFDAVIINANDPLIATSSLKNICNTLVYANNGKQLLGTIVAGKWIIKEGKHYLNDTISSNFIDTISKMGTR